MRAKGPSPLDEHEYAHGAKPGLIGAEAIL